MEPEKMIEKIFKEVDSALKNMAKAKNVETKLAYSQVVKNLCESFGVFAELANSMMPPFDMDDDDPFDMDDE